MLNEESQENTPKKINRTASSSRHSSYTFGLALAVFDWILNHHGKRVGLRVSTFHFALFHESTIVKSEDVTPRTK